MKEIRDMFHSSKKVRMTLIILAALIVVLVIFRAGVSVGYHKATFSSKLGENYYYRAFGREGGPQPFNTRLNELDRNDLTSGHGAAGKIVKISLPTFVVSSPDNIEKVVLISGATEIRRFRDMASSSDLKVDQGVIVLGAPNAEGQIEAHLIRLIPPLPAAASSSPR